MNNIDNNSTASTGTNLVQIGKFCANDKKPQTALSIIFLLLAGIGVGIIFLTKAYVGNIIPAWAIVLASFGFVVIHELIHIVFMSTFAKGKIKVSFKFPTIAVGSDAYFSKAQYIIIALAPVALLGIAMILCLALTPHKLLFAILTILNFASASGDYVLTFCASKQAKGAYFQDNSKETCVFEKQ